MALPGWSEELPEEVEDLTLLPRNCRWTSDPVGVASERIRNVTNGGVRFDTILWDRNIFELVFRFPNAENAEFLAMFMASRANPIYFVPDSSDMATVYQVRCEDSDYLPRSIGEAAEFEGTMQFWYDWTFRISTEQEGVEIED